MKKLMCAFALLLFCSGAFAAENLSCTVVGTLKNYVNYFKGFSLQLNDKSFEQGSFIDTYGSEVKFLANDRDIKVSIKTDAKGESVASIEYYSGHDIYSADLPIKKGRFTYREYQFVDCLGESGGDVVVVCQ